ncbi:prolipoprotein diacylglyceryl transferase [Ramlibacter albus]|uniref:Phosphatidylglycerol--prolipoprotein diacylglyceryl transferase n=1 Tax=Ramlibacter albus TaxID=2079448 RepID=A0A923S5S6_9BURK|nr:prolipoprotein diacylglyceryl transferase [Ramlibacter albus]MBC5768323.1 prolipoprotein diacylglyceryl transferase [Ramlibacter albus]
MVLNYPQFDPIAVKVGPVAIHWYGVTYLVAFGLFFLLASIRLHQQPFARLGWTRKDIEDMLFYGVLGVVVGGRLGYCLFYKPGYYLANPLQILYVWQGGMSFHGGMLGVIASQLLYSRMHGKPFWTLMDFVAPCVPLGLASGRVGNFINGELWGRAADPSLPWAMIFPQSGLTIPRHPSQLYAVLLEGFVLFAVLWFYGRRERKPGEVAALFVLGYGVVRFIGEYFREPDAHLGLLAFGMSMGQWLCVPMIIGGAVLWAWMATREPIRRPVRAS